MTKSGVGRRPGQSKSPLAAVGSWAGQLNECTLHAIICKEAAGLLSAQYLAAESSTPEVACLLLWSITTVENNHGQIWTVRFFLDRERRLRDQALFDPAIDSKLRGCDLVKIKIGDVVAGTDIHNRLTVVQQKNASTMRVI